MDTSHTVSYLCMADCPFVLMCRISSGSTWHAAGMGVRIRGTIAETKICKYGTEFYAQLEQETGLATGDHLLQSWGSIEGNCLIVHL